MYTKCIPVFCKGEALVARADFSTFKVKVEVKVKLFCYYF